MKENERLSTVNHKAKKTVAFINCKYNLSKLLRRITAFSNEKIKIELLIFTLVLFLQEPHCWVNVFYVVHGKKFLKIFIQRKSKINNNRRVLLLKSILFTSNRNLCELA